MNNLPKLIADIKQTDNLFKGIQEGLITGWSDEMLKIPAKGEVKKIEVQYEGSDRPIIVWDYNLPGTRLAEFWVKGNNV